MPTFKHEVQGTEMWDAATGQPVSSQLVDREMV
jgi:hypothetical protein